MQLLAILEDIQSLVENKLNIRLEAGDFVDGWEEVVQVFLQEACHAAVAHCVPWVLDLEEAEHIALDALMARFLEMEIGEAAGQHVHSAAAFVEALAQVPVDISMDDFNHLEAMWMSYFWPKRDLPGMAMYGLTYLRYGQVVYHILPGDDWNAALHAGSYMPESLREEGFIHCSGVDQVLRTANAFFHDQLDLLLLTIAVSKVGSDIRWEDTSQAGENFPHIYASLNLDAVISVDPMNSDSDGKFLLPESKPVLVVNNQNESQAR